MDGGAIPQRAQAAAFVRINRLGSPCRAASGLLRAQFIKQGGALLVIVIKFYRCNKKLLKGAGKPAMMEVQQCFQNGNVRTTLRGWKKGKPVPTALSRGVPACARVLVFALFQKDLVEGIAASGLKG